MSTQLLDEAGMSVLLIANVCENGIRHFGHFGGNLALFILYVSPNQYICCVGRRKEDSLVALYTITPRKKKKIYLPATACICLCLLSSGKDLSVSSQHYLSKSMGMLSQHSSFSYGKRKKVGMA